MNDRVRVSDALRSYRTYDPPSAGFDPRTASQEAILDHGLPRRPDPHNEPELARLWQQVFARPIKYIKAELATSPVASPHDIRHAAKQSSRQKPARWTRSTRVEVSSSANGKCTTAG